MAICFITGVAGFIGSSVANRLLLGGYNVIGIDSFTDYYSVIQKRNNLNELLKNKSFKFYELDLTKSDIKKLLTDVEYIFHFAAQPGIRNGFGENFNHYLNRNILATQMLLEAAKSISLKKFVFASSSSVYGQQTAIEVNELDYPKPISLYGTSKLMSENICRIYFENFGIPVIMLRLFTVYGPRQRPDMAFNKIIQSILNHKKFFVYGSGNQTRDFTFINDIVDACILSAKSNLEGEIFNIGSGRNITLNNTLNIIQNIFCKNLDIEYISKEIGEGENTLANISKAKTLLNYSPEWNIWEGIEEEINWIKTQVRK